MGFPISHTGVSKPKPIFCVCLYVCVGIVNMSWVPRESQQEREHPVQYPDFKI